MKPSGRLPNFVYIGPDKAGSSWLHEALSHHPQIKLSEAKDLYFFDRFYSRGEQWYANQFRGTEPQHVVVGEVCPDYLASPEAPARMHHVIPEAKLVVTLRDPATRAFSSYLYMRKHGEGPSTFREALSSFPDLLEHGRYGTQLSRFQEFYSGDSLFVGLFDDLRTDPQGFIDGLTDWLGLNRNPLPDGELEARLPASRARVPLLAWLVRRSADFVRTHDGAKIVGRIKRSRLVHSVLYEPLGEDAPVLADDDRDLVRDTLMDEVVEAERLSGLPLRERWGWPVAGRASQPTTSAAPAERQERS
ncbi:hypothetical protein BA895_08295 [Humibacillus sp. DSM 29435]|uniref:sulfotransferase family protein n=1 Tax=Humibacillus sp. DSM 29435 TaxID=1869167 RepID=UPI000872AF31|nr:sulfotransferase [Humibacillus sp. DSM 29435]OFE15111.1 hypothetical protein BA895_08295 [Humibacillus sp. DSM 29435]